LQPLPRPRSDEAEHWELDVTGHRGMRLYLEFAACQALHGRCD